MVWCVENVCNIIIPRIMMRLYGNNYTNDNMTYEYACTVYVLTKHLVIITNHTVTEILKPIGTSTALNNVLTATLIV